MFVALIFKMNLCNFFRPEAIISQNTEYIREKNDIVKYKLL